MKKALIVTTVSGFVPQFEMNNVHILQEMGYEVHYASNYQNISYGLDNHHLDGTGIVQHQVDFSRSPFDFKTNFLAYQQLKKIMKKENFSILHCHTPVAAVLSRIVAKNYRKQGLKVIYTAHGFHFYKGAPLKYWLLFYPIERLLAKFTDILITINKEDYERAKRFCWNKKTKVEFIHGVGIDINYWNGQYLKSEERKEIRKRIRKELGLTQIQTAILSVGELIPRKNHELVIRTLAELKKEIDRPFCYFICGQGVLQEELQRLTKELKMFNEVVFLGYREDVRNLLYGVDLFLFPSKQEGMPMALMEAISTGIPIRASNIRGNREWVLESTNHKDWLFNDSVELKECLKRALDIKQVEKIMLPKRYDICHITKKMKQIYEALE